MKKILLLITLILSFPFISCGDDKDEQDNLKEHEWVDLGLPSGTLWATCNIGADNPEEYGDYFAWGETAPKEVYEWSTYKWNDRSNGKFTKYCTDSKYGTIDNNTELLSEDDAAYVNWGKNWRMPSLEQIRELINCCSWLWTTRNGVNGQLVTGPNGNTMFLPAAGNRQKLHHCDAGMGYYLSRTLKSDQPGFACGLYLGPAGWLWGYGHREYGQTVRAVRVSQN